MSRQQRENGDMSASLAAVARTVQEMRRRPHDPLTVKDLARQANLGVWQYRMLFKQLTGRTPSDYLTRLRINRSKELLLTTRDKVSQVARSAGYPDEYYFNRRFKQSEGITPKQYARDAGRRRNVIALAGLGDLLAIGVRPVAADAQVLSWLAAGDTVGIERVSLGSEQRIAALRPDIVLANRYTDARLIESLRPAAPVVMLEEGLGMLDSLRSTAGLLGMRGEAAAWIERYEANAEAAGAVRRELARGETALFVHVVRDALYLYRPEQMPVLYDVLGFLPPPRLLEAMRTARRLFIPPAVLAEYAADRLFVVCGTMPGARDTYAELLGGDSWSRLPAVRAGQVYHPDERWTLDGTIALEWQLAGIRQLMQRKTRQLR